MEKPRLEYVQINASAVKSDDGPEQFFLLNDDGTVIGNGPVQYVAQVADVNDVTSETLYNVSHQYFVGMEPGAQLSTGLQLQTQPGPSNSRYNEAYSLQNEPQPQDVQMVTNELEDDQPLIIPDILPTQNVENKEIENCTQVTLDEEQYRILEEKGKLLLGVENKIYVLDIIHGLHEITDNVDLIRSVHREIYGNQAYDDQTVRAQDFSEEIVAYPDTLQNNMPIVSEQYTKDEEQNNEADNKETIEICKKIEAPSEMGNPEIAVNISPQESNQTKIVITEGLPQDLLKNILKSISLAKSSQKKMFSPLPELIPAPAHNVPIKNIILRNSFKSKPRNSRSMSKKQTNNTTIVLAQKKNCRNTAKNIKLKANCLLKDIPQKIFLGTNAAGKKLYAKVLDVKCSGTNKMEEPIDLQQKSEVEKVNINRDKLTTNDGKLNPEVWLVVEKALCNEEQWISSHEDVKLAESIMQSLLNITPVRPMLIGQKVLVTKMVQKVNNRTTLLRMLPSVVSGRVMEVSENDKNNFVCQFFFSPHIARDVKNSSLIADDRALPEAPTEGSEECDCIVHVHVTTVIQPPLKTITSVALLKRRLPLRLKTRVESIHACCSCASIFITENQLIEHQKTGCNLNLKNEDTKIIKVTKAVPSSIDDNKIKLLSCKYCEKVFTRSSQLQRHMSTHSIPEETHAKPLERLDNPEADGSTDKKTYSCRMCTSAFFYPSTLTRHILTKHIDVNNT